MSIHVAIGGGNLRIQDDLATRTNMGGEEAWASN
jgi:hypothetical protein